MKRLLALTALILGIGFNSNSQNAFDSKINTKNSDEIIGIAALSNKDYIICQSGNKYDPAGESIFLTRFDACHNIIWSKKIQLRKYSQIGSKFGNKNFLVYNDSNYYLSLTITEDNRFSNFLLFLKITGNGNILWTRKIAMYPKKKFKNYYFISTHVDITQQGEIIAASIYEYKGINTNYDSTFFSFSKLTSSGIFKWTKNYGGFHLYNSTIRVQSVDKIMTNEIRNSHFIFASSKIVNIPGNYLIQIDSVGNILAFNSFTTQVIPPASEFEVQDALIDKNGNIYAMGNIVTYKYIYQPLDDYYFVMNLNASGMPKYLKYFANKTKDKVGAAIRLTRDNKLMVLSYNLMVLSYNISVSSHEPNGKLIWSKKIKLPQSFITSTFSNLSPDTGIFVGSFYFNQIIKLGRNGFSSCGSEPDTLKEDSLEVYVSKLPIPKRARSFQVIDTTLKTVDAPKPTETILCSTQPYPKANLGNDTVLCSQKKYILDVGPDTAGFDYLWNTGDTTHTITIDSSGNYSVSVSYGQCTASDDITVIFKDQIKANISDTAICAYDSVLLRTPDIAGNPFIWIMPKQDTVNANEVWAKQEGTYYLQLKAEQQCKKLDSVKISHHPLPTSMAGPDTTLCYNQTYTMQGAGGITFKWIPAIYLSSDSIADPVAQLPHSQKYLLIVSNEFGCSDTSEVMLTVKPQLELEVTASKAAICESEVVELTATGKGGIPEDYDFEWIPGNGSGESFSRVFSNSSWQKVILSDNCSQATADSIFITVHPNPEAAFTTVPADTAFVNNAVQFINESRQATAFTWHFGNGQQANQIAPFYEYRDTGNYQISLVAFNPQNCSDTAFGEIYVEDAFTVFIPNAISVNDDLLNDTWKIKGQGIRSYTFEIYNSWGELVFVSDGARDGWTGTFDNQEIRTSGVFVYRLSVIDKSGASHFYRGVIHLVR